MFVQNSSDFSILFYVCIAVLKFIEEKVYFVLQILILWRCAISLYILKCGKAKESERSYKEREEEKKV